VLKIMKQIEKKKEKNSKKILSLHSCLFSFVRCLAQIQSNHRLISFEFSLSLCALLSRTTTNRFIFKGSSKGVLFCSAKSFVTVFTAVILLNDDERERDIYHTQKTLYKCRNNRRWKNDFKKQSGNSFARTLITI
jgi:hypothetical protein